MRFRVECSFCPWCGNTFTPDGYWDHLGADGRCPDDSPLDEIDSDLVSSKTMKLIQDVTDGNKS